MSSVIKVLIRQVGLPHRVPSLGGERGGEFRWPITSASARFTFTAGDGDREGVMWGGTSLWTVVRLRAWRGEGRILLPLAC